MQIRRERFTFMDIISHILMRVARAQSTMSTYTKQRVSLSLNSLVSAIYLDPRYEMKTSDSSPGPYRRLRMKETAKWSIYSDAV